MNVKEAVRKGEAWLDEHKPGWYNDIDLEKHDQQSAYTCVLGQLDVRPGARWMDILQRAGLKDTQANAMGFGSHPLEDLNAAWHKRITKRRAADATAAEKLSPARVPGIRAVYMTDDELEDLHLISTEVDGVPYTFTRDSLGKYLAAPRTQEFFLSIKSPEEA